MKLACITAIAIVAAQSGWALGQASSAPASASSSSKKTLDFAERYGVLAEKNIFVRNRPPTRKAGARSTGPNRPEAMHVLTGIALQEGRHVAFIEDTAARRTERLLQGDTVAGGKLVDVTFDAVEFEINARTIHVAIGRNLLGDAAPAPASPAPAPTTSTATNSAPTPTAPPGARTATGNSTSNNANAAPPPPPLPNAPNLSPEERMKLRRQQQMGGGR